MHIVYKSLPRRRFGVELEVSNNVNKQWLGDVLKRYEASTSGRDVVITSGLKGWAETRQNTYWHVKYDSTCGPKGKGKDNGWEVASYIGWGRRDLTNISQAAGLLGLCGAEVNTNCGLHIHVDAGDLSATEMGVLLARWLKFEDILFGICDPSRTNNKYCRPLRQRWQLRSWRGYDPLAPDAFCRNIGPSDLSTHDNEDKKVSLNTVGWTTGQIAQSYSRKTVELRLPECRLELPHVLHWTSLILNFVDSCKGQSVGPDDLEPARSLREALVWLGFQGMGDEFFLFEKKLLDTKLWLLNKIAGVATGQAREAAELIEFVSKI